MAASVPTCFPNGFEWVPEDPMAAPREDCFAVFCLPHRIVDFPIAPSGQSTQPPTVIENPWKPLEKATILWGGQKTAKQSSHGAAMGSTGTHSNPLGKQVGTLAAIG